MFIAKNSGLRDKTLEIIKEENLSGKTIEVRGEDVPSVVLNLLKQNKNAIGITGEDLFKEFLLENKDTGLQILKRKVWCDENYLFGKPTLCLLGAKDKRLEDLPKRLKICVNSKYKKLAKRYCLNFLEEKGYSFEKIYASGATEEFFSNGIADIVIDVVCSGKSAEKAGLKVYDKLFESDIVIIGKEGKTEKFDLETLYGIIKKRIEGKSEKSYTYKLFENRKLLRSKILEEARELVDAKNKKQVTWEAADLLYFVNVFLASRGVSLKDVENKLMKRNKNNKKLSIPLKKEAQNGDS